MSEQEGIVMANGVVLKDGLNRLKDGLNRFKADRNLVSKSLLYVAKISKGLHSGVLNSDPDFIKFQQESLDGLVKKETEKLCDKVVLGAESQLARLSGTIAIEKAATSYLYGRRGSKEVEPIILEAPSTLRSPVNKTSTGLIKELIEKTGDELASLNKGEVAYLKEMNKETKKITDLRKKVRKKILDGTIKKKVTKKVAKKKTSKKNVRSKKNE